MVDTQKLNDAITTFASSSKPTSGSGNTPATVDDINRVVNNLSNLLHLFVDELE